VAGRDSLQAVILAGGQGTRLRPLTLARAKPVVPLLNRPFLAYQLALLRAHGVIDVVLACSYRVDDVRAALGDAEHLGVRLRYVVEDEPLGTGVATPPTWSRRNSFRASSPIPT
jgi:mannose-1-phosphate guanylyltransferase